MNASEKKAIVKRACEIIYSNEGDYGSVNKNDNGALSIGKVQWHADRALSLLRDIIKANESQAKTILGDTLFNEIKTTTSNWSNRIVNTIEANCITKLLITSAGKKVQDKLAEKDVESYIDIGISYGIQDPDSLIYFADGINQYGSYSKVWKNIAIKSVHNGDTLDSIHAAASSMASQYISRRIKTYNIIKGHNTVSKSNTYTKYKDSNKVKYIQGWVNTQLLGTNFTALSVDGVIGLKTKAGIVKCLQQCLNHEFNANLDVDGIFGRMTQIACPTVTTYKCNSGDIVHIIQFALYCNDIEIDKFDYYYGSKTANAVGIFQRRNNLPITERVDDTVFKSLFDGF